MNNLSKRAKIALASGGAGLLILAVALGIWQPWNQDQEEQNQNPPPQNQQEPAKSPETGPTLTVGGEKISCTIYEGDGWSIYVPEGWTADDSGAEYGTWKFYPGEDGGDTYLMVERSDGQGYAGTFVGAYPYERSETERYMMRIFYARAPGEQSWEITCCAAEANGAGHKLMTAMARTFTAGGDKLFSGLSPVASEPDWQTTEDGTILWMDKDGYVVDAEASKYVEAEMLGWDDATKEQFTGRYRLTNLEWAGSYTCLPGREYVDIFQFGVQYEVAPGKEEERLEELKEVQMEDLLQDGWEARGRYPLNVVIFHDGSSVEEVRVFQSNLDNPGGPLYLSSLLRDDPESAEALTAEQLKQCADYFNDRENNGLLRFEMDPDQYKGLLENLQPYLTWIFYDLGEYDFSEAEDEMFQKMTDTGEWMDLDKSRLSRTYIAAYMKKKFGLSAEETDSLLASTKEPLGVYAEEFDAWYMCHGDTEMCTYRFDSGYQQGDGRCVLFYTNGFVRTNDGQDTEINAPMRLVISPSPTEPGGWRVDSNVIVE